MRIRETIQQYKARRRREIFRRVTISVVSITAGLAVLIGSNMDIVRADAKAGKMIDACYWDGFVLNDQATLIETCDGHVWEFDCPILDKDGNVLPVNTDITVLFDGMRTDNRTDDVPVMIMSKEGEILQ